MPFFTQSALMAISLCSAAGILIDSKEVDVEYTATFWYLTGCVAFLIIMGVSIVGIFACCADCCPRTKSQSPTNQARINDKTNSQLSYRKQVCELQIVSEQLEQTIEQNTLQFGKDNIGGIERLKPTKKPWNSINSPKTSQDRVYAELKARGNQLAVQVDMCAEALIASMPQNGQQLYVVTPELPLLSKTTSQRKSANNTMTRRQCEAAQQSASQYSWREKVRMFDSADKLTITSAHREQLKETLQTKEQTLKYKSKIQIANVIAAENQALKVHGRYRQTTKNAEMHVAEIMQKQEKQLDSSCLRVRMQQRREARNKEQERKLRQQASIKWNEKQYRACHYSAVRTSAHEKRLKLANQVELDLAAHQTILADDSKVKYIGIDAWLRDSQTRSSAPDERSTVIYCQHNK